ncbi:putative sigma-54 modulation protein [Flavobacterium sp. CG_23.5]|uniref:HPF/RaiA family ribosome-associated protein n=1 Tax=Flavobacterium sp. CG_23.5 TaxID=2760708 RepID=UPI001AE10213|nr:HPF/RaiA family ribosome-associated protein [Flavobacterium sp. CG_23.5]MBP2282797.1 putative sigma-54 modulation protein [Flavobacterium sp. CG_23.5]
MEIITQFVRTNKNNTAQKLVTEKLELITKHFDWVIRANVIFKEDKVTYGKGKICEIILSCPGVLLFASADNESFEVAIAESIRDLEIQLHKRKSELQTF